MRNNLLFTREINKNERWQKLVGRLVAFISVNYINNLYVLGASAPYKAIKVLWYFALKIFLIHEIMQMCDNFLIFKLYIECYFNFGQKVGNKVWHERAKNLLFQYFLYIKTWKSAGNIFIYIYIFFFTVQVVRFAEVEKFGAHNKATATNFPFLSLLEMWNEKRMLQKLQRHCCIVSATEKCQQFCKMAQRCDTF
jgi:hypothetical protein